MADPKPETPTIDWAAIRDAPVSLGQAYPGGVVAPIPQPSDLSRLGSKKTTTEQLVTGLKLSAGMDDDRIPSRTEAENMASPKWWESLMLQMEMIDYARGLAWYGSAGMLSAYPNIDSSVGKKAQKYAGKALGVGAKAVPLASSYKKIEGFVGKTAVKGALPFGLGQALPSPDVSFEPLLKSGKTQDAIEKLGENVYKHMSAGTLYDHPRHFHGDHWYSAGHPRDTPKKMPNVTGDQILDLVLPRDKSREIAALAKAEGQEALSGFFQRMGDDELFRAGVGIIPEMILDPLWFVGPAKMGQVASKGGRTFLMGSDLSSAGKAVSLINPNVTNHAATNIVLDFAAGTADDAAAATNLLGKTVAQARKTAENYTKKSTLAYEASKNPAKAVNLAKTEHEAATQAITDAISNYKQRQATPAMAKALGFLEDTEGLAKVQKMFDEDRAQLLDKLKKTEQKMAQKAAELVNPQQAQLYLKASAKQDESFANFYKFQARQIEKVLELEGTALSAQASIKKGLAVHIPFTTKQTSIGLSNTFYLTPKTKLGDTASSIAERVGLQIVDLAKLNGLSEVRLNAKIAKGEKIKVQVGGGVGKGLLSKVPFLSEVPDLFGSTFSPKRMRDLEQKLSSSLTAGEKFTLFLDSQSKVGGKGWHLLKNIPMLSMDLLARAFGTRKIQPWLAARDLDKALMYYSERGAGAEAFRNLRHGERVLLRLRKTIPDVWDNYQRALGNFQDGLKAEQTRIRQSVYRWAHMANRIAEERITANPKLKDHNYSSAHVFQEVANILETGAGKYPTELSPIIKDLKALMTHLEAKTGKAYEEINQALVAIYRFGEGDVRAAREITDDILETLDLLETAKAIDPIVGKLQDITRGLSPLEAKAAGFGKKIKETEHSLKALQKEVKERGTTRLAELKASQKQKMVDAAAKSKLATIKKTTGNKQIRLDLSAKIKSEKAALKSSQEKKLSDLVDRYDAQIASTEKGRKKIIGERAGKRKEIEAEQLVDRATLDKKFKAEKKKLATEIKKQNKAFDAAAKSKKKNLEAELKAEKASFAEERQKIRTRNQEMQDHVKARIQKRLDVVTELRDKLKASEESIRKGIFPDDLTAAINSAQTKVGDLESRLAEKMVARSLVTPILKAPVGDSKQFIRKLRAWEEELWEGAQDIMKDYSEQDRLRAVLATMSSEGMYKGLPEDMIRKGERYQKLHDAYVKAGIGAVKKVKKDVSEIETAARLGKRLESVQKKLLKAKGGQKTRLERELKEIQAEIFETLPAKDEALFGMRRERAELEGKSEQVDEWLKKHSEEAQKEVLAVSARQQEEALETTSLFPSVVGERMAKEIPKDIEPLVNEFRGMLKHYEKMYRQHGHEFMRDPLERMKLWGVTDYFPHLRKDHKMPIEDILDPLRANPLDRTLSMEMDAAKHRKLSGTIEEINSVVRANQNNYEFSLDPQLLMARFYNDARALKNQDFLWALNRGGVIRHFRSTNEAIEHGYVPLYERSVPPELHAQYEAFLRLEEPFLAKDAAGNDVTRKLMEQFHKMEEGKRAPLISWAEDIKFLNDTRTVEHSLAGIKSSQIKQTEVGGSLVVPLMEGKLFDAEKRWMQLKTMNMTFGIKDINKKISNLQSRIQALKRKQALHKNPDTWSKAIHDAHNQIVNEKLKLAPDSDAMAKLESKSGDAAWKTLTEEINRHVAAINLRKGHGLDELFDNLGRLPSVNDKSVRLFVGEGTDNMLRQYIPEGVHESMRIMFSPAFGADLPVIGGTLRGLHKATNWMKARVTFVAIAFSTRNAIGNTFQNMMDLGVGGVLNPDTNLKSFKLARMADYHSSYGSLRKAYDSLNAPRGADESGISGAYRYAQRKLQAQEFKKMYDPAKLNTIDLGDGKLREIDDALTLLNEKGVVSGSDTFHADVDQIHNQFQEIAFNISRGEAGKRSRLLTANRWYNNAEDAVILSLGPLSAASGGSLLPVALPKNWGALLSRTIENQARAVNFIANMKRGGTVETAAAHANKFLMNYHDLTPTQKTWTRLVFPFFTWNQKNFLLTMEMMEKNPVYFSTMYRTLYEWFPRITEAIEADEKGTELSAHIQADERQKDFRYLPKYNMYKVRIPIDMANRLFFEGVGLPIEGFSNQVATIGNLVVPVAAFLGSQEAKYEADRRQLMNEGGTDMAIAQSHWFLRTIYEIHESKYTFYDRDFDDQRSRHAGDLAYLATHLEDTSGALGIPAVGKFLGSHLRHSMGLTIRAEKGQAYWYIDGDKMNWKYAIESVNPNFRHLRASTMMSDLGYNAMFTEAARAGDRPTSVRQPLWQRKISATTGFKIKQDIPVDVAARRFERDVREIIEKAAHVEGIKRRYEIK